MRKLLCVVLIAVTLLSLASVPAVAADGDSSGSWWSWETIKQKVAEIFVPPKDYFHNHSARMSAMIKIRLQSVGDLLQIFEVFLNELKNPASAKLEMKLPKDYIYKGAQPKTFNVFEPIQPMISFIRAVITAAAMLMIFISCYHHMRTVFEQ